jgi:transcriptional regulator with XRE-family HTH domain
MKPNEHIKKYMEKHHLSINRMAKVLGVSRGTIANYVRGKTVPPRFLIYALRYVEEKGYWNEPGRSAVNGTEEQETRNEEVPGAQAGQAEEEA